eukprot:SAG22_NODE_2642_length_2345_cov_1.625111_1_plen_98_part_00
MGQKFWACRWVVLRLIDWSGKFSLILRCFRFVIDPQLYMYLFHRSRAKLHINNMYIISPYLYDYNWAMDKYMASSTYSAMLPLLEQHATQPSPTPPG